MNVENNMVTAQMPTSTLPNYSNQTSEQSSQLNTGLKTPLLQQGASVPGPQKKTGFEKLKSVEGMYITQSVQNLEFLSLCDTSEKHYFIYDSKEHKSGSEILKMVERTKYRNCGFDMDLEINHGNPGSTTFLKFERRSQGCSYIRPEMDVFVVEGGPKVKLGKVKFPSQCWGQTLEAYDAKDSLRYVLKKSCCQSWGTQGAAELTVHDPFGSVVEKLERFKNDRLKKDATALGWTVNFPKDSREEDRALLIAAIMMAEQLVIDTVADGSSSDCPC